MGFSGDFSSAVWRKSSRSGDDSTGSCVEVAFVEAAVGLRDSKNVTGGHLTFGGAAWEAFTGGVLASTA